MENYTSIPARQLKPGQIVKDYLGEDSTTFKVEKIDHSAVYMTIISGPAKYCQDNETKTYNFAVNSIGDWKLLSNV